MQGVKLPILSHYSHALLQACHTFEGISRTKAPSLTKQANLLQFLRPLSANKEPYKLHIATFRGIKHKTLGSHFCCCRSTTFYSNLSESSL